MDAADTTTRRGTSGGWIRHDGGRTWTPRDRLTVFQENIGKANVLSPSLLRLDEKALLCFFVVTNEALVDGGTWMKRSSDNGKTWSKPERLPYEGYGGSSLDRACLTSKGRIVLPCWVSTDRLASTHVYCLYSDDRGKTWKKTARLSTPKGSSGRGTDPAAEEPTVVELKDGRLMMLMRTYLKSLYVSYSDDDGTTWSTPRSSGIPSPGDADAPPDADRRPPAGLELGRAGQDRRAVAAEPASVRSSRPTRARPGRRFGISTTAAKPFPAR